MKSEKKACKRKLQDALKSLDMHGEPVTFSYKGSSTFKSQFGGVLTILSRASIAAFLFVMMTHVFNNEYTVVFKSVFHPANGSN